MDKKIDKQIERVLFLNEMMKEVLEKRVNYLDDWQKWREEVEEKGPWRVGDSPEKPTNAEIKRIMLVVRQETIKLDKMMRR